jgi:hypothetical protein
MESDPKEVYFVRSMADWKQFCRSSDSPGHPLGALTEDEVREFTGSLVFNNGGLAGAYLGKLQDRLSYREYRALMAAFGMDIGFAADYEGYYCMNPGDCAKKMDHICTSNC